MNNNIILFPVIFSTTITITITYHYYPKSVFNITRKEKKREERRENDLMLRYEPVKHKKRERIKI